MVLKKLSETAKLDFFRFSPVLKLFQGQKTLYFQVFSFKRSYFVDLVKTFLLHLSTVKLAGCKNVLGRHQSISYRPRTIR